VKNRNQQGMADTTSDKVSAGAGGVVGAAAGAGLGSLAGPVGTIIGGLAGAVGGWWSGRAVSEAASSYSDDDDAFYRSHHASSFGDRESIDYDTARPVYQLGHLAGMNPDYKGRAFSDIEPHLATAYTSAGHRDWDRVRSAANDAFRRGREVGEQRLILSEEELRVGKRQVQSGEVSVRKTVETEHVTESVPLVREEITIERRPISADAAHSGNVEIGENEIRIPLMAEEAVVEKRVVGTEEITLRKQQVTEEETVEADLRRERLDEEGLRRTQGHTDRESPLRTQEGGLADRIADAADDVKDRFDGNPASRPGRDATDRPGR
jgi:uncharacterized protein (TIGR02271 family)